LAMVLPMPRDAPVTIAVFCDAVVMSSSLLCQSGRVSPCGYQNLFAHIRPMN
jgi:hypothetical protein